MLFKELTCYHSFFCYDFNQLVFLVCVVPEKALGRTDVPWDWAQTAGRRTAEIQWSGSVPPLWSPNSVWNVWSCPLLYPVLHKYIFTFNKKWFASWLKGTTMSFKYWFKSCIWLNERFSWIFDFMRTSVGQTEYMHWRFFYSVHLKKVILLLFPTVKCTYMTSYRWFQWVYCKMNL